MKVILKVVGLCAGIVAVGAGCKRAPEPAAAPPVTVAAATPAPEVTMPAEPAAVPLGADLTPAELERQRFSNEWQQLGSFQASPMPMASGSPMAEMSPGAATSPGASPAAAGGGNVTFATGKGAPEKITGLDPATIDTLPMRVPIKGDLKGPSVLRTQVRLDRAGFSPGAIDGRWGKNSVIAVYWFQRQNNLQPTGVVDEATYRSLASITGEAPTLQTYTLTADDAKGPYTKLPKDVYEKAKLDCLCYEDLAEALAERFHTTKEFVKTLNGGLTAAPAEGQTVTVPAVRTAGSEGGTKDVKRIVISARGNYLHALDEGGKLLFHAPTTLGSKYDPSPNETLKITNIAWKPDFKYQPKLFADVPDSEPEANLKPGPNSPVGVVWMALSKPHFGIHGTADPDSIGYASSHGCVRLSNWDANDLGRRVAPGVTVEFVDTPSPAAAAAAASGAASPQPKEPVPTR